MLIDFEMGYEPWDFSLMEDPGALDYGIGDRMVADFYYLC